MTHSIIIKQLGDTALLARYIGEAPSTVSNWKSRGIPWRWRPRIAAIAKERGIPMPDDFFEMNVAP